METYRQLTTSFFEKAGYYPNITCEVFQPSLIAEMINAGIGVSLLPYVFAEHKGLVSLDIIDPLCTHDIYFVWMEDRHLSNASQIFLNFTLEFFKDYPRGTSAFL